MVEEGCKACNWYSGDEEWFGCSHCSLIDCFTGAVDCCRVAVVYDDERRDAVSTEQFQLQRENTANRHAQHSLRYYTQTTSPIQQPSRLEWRMSERNDRPAQHRIRRQWTAPAPIGRSCTVASDVLHTKDKTYYNRHQTTIQRPLTLQLLSISVY